MKVVMLGATRGIGRSLARLLASRGESIHVLGRNADDLAKCAEDLKVRGTAAVSTSLCDLMAPATFGPALEAADAALGGFDTVILSAGVFGPQDELANDRARAAAVLTANFTNSVLFCEEARVRLLARGGGRLVAFSSVAGDRGRKPIVIYGSTKAALSAYLEGLDHKFHAQGLHVLTVKPGFVKTGMTAGLKPPPFAGEPEQVARDVVRAIDKKRTVLYTPFMWRWVMLVIRSLPRFVMRKIGF
ncbi:MAG TPA: SDR family NAD(P)-dependent oxidoreductase [Vicinamibacteria bacterium]|nr:SDR family NAD(P)-dependent oxidoreductase [Vicinamibacteria bacterium]